MCLFKELVFMADWWANLDLEYFIDKDDYEKYYGKEHAYCIMNHTFEIDWLVGWVTSDKINLLGVSALYSNICIFHFLFISAISIYVHYHCR